MICAEKNWLYLVGRQELAAWVTMLHHCQESEPMPVHNWTLVDDGTYHDFHNGWIVHLKDELNEGVLPKGYYAQSEQHSLEYTSPMY
jgi:hypothetical protein